MNEKNKKIILISAIAVVLLILGLIVFFNISVEKESGENMVNEIVPQEEISDEQFRETTIELFYIDGDNKLVPEIKKIDSKDLLANPYEVVLQLLLNGPLDNSLKTVIPQDTKINKITKQGDCLTIDLSKEFAANNDKENSGVMKNAVNQIVYTVTQFTEINKVKISIDGETNISIGDNISLNQDFSRDE